MPKHSSAQLAEVHAPISFEYATAASRLAATGFIATDCNKFARQLNDNTIWMLTQPDPPIWESVGGGNPGITTQQPTQAGIASDGLPHTIDSVSTILFWAAEWTVMILLADDSAIWTSRVHAAYDGSSVYYVCYGGVGTELALSLDVTLEAGTMTLRVTSNEAQALKASVIRTPVQKP